MSQLKIVLGILLMTIPLLGVRCRQKEIHSETTMNPATTHKIRLTAGNTVLTGTLYDNASTRDFLAQLPLTLTLSDYNGTEKISDLPNRLSTTGAPAGYDPSAGDITYYAPWGNLALFYKDFSYSTGLVVLGKLDSGVATFTGPGSVQVIIERSE